MKSIVTTFGRMNPPHLGHAILINKIKEIASDKQHLVFISQTEDKKKNPLSFEEKMLFLKLMFPDTVFYDGTDVRTPFDAMKKLSDEGFNDVTLVAGEDRCGSGESKSFNFINNYIRHSEPEKSLDFDHFKIVCAGVRNPDSDGADGMSASKIRTFINEDDFTSFDNCLPDSIKIEDKKKLYNLLKKKMSKEIL